MPCLVPVIISLTFKLWASFARKCLAQLLDPCVRIFGKRIGIENKVRRNYAWSEKVGTKEVIETWCQFHQHSKSSFCKCRSRKRKKDWQLDCLFCPLGICSSKSWSWNVDEIDPWIREVPCFPDHRTDSTNISSTSWVRTNKV